MIDLINLDISTCKEITDNLDYLTIQKRIRFLCKNKRKVLDYLKRHGEEYACLTCSAMDYVTNKHIKGISLKTFTDGEYLWTNEEVYHFEKYNLKLNDDFIRHVLEQEDTTNGT